MDKEYFKRKKYYEKNRSFYTHHYEKNRSFYHTSLKTLVKTTKKFVVNEIRVKLAKIFIKVLTF